MKLVAILLDHLIPALEAIKKDILIEINRKKAEKESLNHKEKYDTHDSDKTMSSSNCFHTFEQACQLLSVSKGFLYKQTSSKRIPYYKIGGKILFKEAQLLEWVEKRFIKPL